MIVHLFFVFLIWNLVNTFVNSTEKIKWFYITQKIKPHKILSYFTFDFTKYFVRLEKAQCIKEQNIKMFYFIYLIFYTHDDNSIAAIYIMSYWYILFVTRSIQTWFELITLVCKAMFFVLASPSCQQLLTTRVRNKTKFLNYYHNKFIFFIHY